MEDEDGDKKKRTVSAGNKKAKHAAEQAKEDEADKAEIAKLMVS
jgi:hypothetical protein